MPYKANLEATVRREPGAAVIDLRGEVHAFSSQALARAYEQALATGLPVILLNFGAVDYINSSGIALIVRLVIEADRSRRRVLACSVADHFAELFRVIRLTDFVAIFPDEASALVSVAQCTSAGQATAA